MGSQIYSECNPRAGLDTTTPHSAAATAATDTYKFSRGGGAGERPRWNAGSTLEAANGCNGLAIATVWRLSGALCGQQLGRQSRLRTHRLRGAWGGMGFHPFVWIRATPKRRGESLFARHECAATGEYPVWWQVGGKRLPCGEHVGPWCFLVRMRPHVAGRHG